MFMVLPLPILRLKSPSTALNGFLRNTTVRVVAAVLFCLGAVLFFQHVPKALRWPVRVGCLFAVIWLILITIQTVRRTAWTGKKLLFSLILGSFCYGLPFLCCHVFIRLMSARDDRISTRIIDSHWRATGFQGTPDKEKRFQKLNLPCFRQGPFSKPQGPRLLKSASLRSIGSG